MKNYIILILLFVATAAQAQVNQFLGGPTTRVINRGIFSSQVGIAVAKDTALPAWADRTIPYIAEKGTKLYRWSTSSSAWVELGTGSTVAFVDVIGNPADNTQLRDTLATYQHLLPIGTVSQYYRGDQTLSNFSSDVITVTDPLYVPIDDSLKKVIAEAPLYFRADSQTLYINSDAQVFNARKITGISVQTGTPQDGDGLMYQASSNTWIYQPFDAASVAVASIFGYQVRVKDMFYLTLIGMWGLYHHRNRRLKLAS